MTKWTLRDIDGSYYSENGLDVTDALSSSMKFDSVEDAARVKGNLNNRFILPFEIVKVIAEPFGSHGLRWHVYACDECGNFPGEMEDPTYDASRVLPGTKPLWICEHCAKIRIESEMYKVVN